MYENGSIQRSNIRTYELVSVQLKNHLRSSYTIFLTNNTVESTKMVAFNALTSGHIRSNIHT